MYLKKHLYLFFSILSFILVSVIIINYITDPFQIFHKTEEKFINNPRIQNAGLINSYLDSDDGYDSLIIGNSLSMGLKNKETAEIMGWNKVLKLSAAGSLPYTQKITLEYALKTNKVKNVLWFTPIINYSNPEKSLGQFEKNFSNFTYLYDENPFNEIKYLLNAGTLKKSISLLIGINLKRKPMDKQNLGYIRNSKWDKWSTKSNIDKLYKKYKKAFDNTLQFKEHINDDTFVNSKSLDNNLVKIIINNPNVQFTIIIPPYSYFLTQSIYLQQLSGIKILLSKTFHLSNLKIYGFANESFIKNQYYYRDKRHYSSEIASYMLSLIKKGREPLSLDNIDKYQKEILDNLNNYKKIYAKNTHIYSNYIEVSESQNMVYFTLHPKKPHVQVSFNLQKEKKIVYKGSYSKNLTYKIDKAKFSVGKYRVRYTLIDGNASEADKNTYKEVGYSKSITID